MAPRDRAHIVVPQGATAEPYRRPPRAIGSRAYPAPADRAGHGVALAAALRTAEEEGEARREQAQPDLAPASGIYVVIESFPDLPLMLESLDPRSKGRHPELVAVSEARVDDQVVTRATLFIPDGTLGYFLRRAEAYVETAGGARGKHRPLLDRIRSIGLASLREFWTDAPDDYPETEEIRWWEVWLRRRGGEEISQFLAFATARDLRIGRQALAFADRSVVLVEATPEALSTALDVLDDLAELRSPKAPAEALAADSAVDQAAWVDVLAERLVAAGPDAPAVCVVDTGVFQPHPILVDSLDASDCHACDPAWGSDDHAGHGTEMAGVALLGSVGDAIAGAGPLTLRHRLESVKLLPPPPAVNPPELYGAVTATAASLVEIEAPQRRRVFSTAVTAEVRSPADVPPGSFAFGQPSSWSAAVDALAAGLGVAGQGDQLVFLDEEAERQRRLFLFAAGNVDDFADDHLANSDVQPVEDPGQAWNAVTVGAYTDRVSMSGAPADYAGWTAVAPAGELSPFSRTSVAFSRGWPLKPDIVCEGGNLAVAPTGDNYDTPDVLSLLTTKAPLGNPRLLTVTRETSAATAQAAHISAQILAEYPGLWPETVRALLVHSAEWTPAMAARFSAAGSRAQKVALQRRYGMGVPDIARALRSATDALTLVVQDTIHPFEDGRMREMHVHELPWPQEELAELGSASVRLRVTLSYFVEPSPGRRGWVRRYSYASHGLRFEVRRPTESTADLRQRVNQLARLQDEDRHVTQSDASEWFFGPDQRAAGSLHTDIWTGTAADLAERGALVVYPVSGWWKERPTRDRSDDGARYALVVSIETPEQETDIWTPVANQVGVPIAVEIAADEDD